MDSTQTVKDHYQTLGVPRSASAKDIKAAWRKLAVKAHPDRGGSAEAFNKLREAYEVLGDPPEKLRYDAHLEYEEQKAAWEQDKAQAKEQARSQSWDEPSYDPMSTWRPQGPRGREVPVTDTPRATVRRATGKSKMWPKFIRDNASTASIVLVVSWVTWALERSGALHAKNLSSVVGHASAPSMSSTAVLVTLGWAWGLAFIVNWSAKRLGPAREFICWLGAGLLGLYVEPLAWIPLVQQLSVGVLGAVLVWLVFIRVAPSKAQSLMKWRPVKKTRDR